MEPDVATEKQSDVSRAGANPKGTGYVGKKNVGVQLAKADDDADLVSAPPINWKAGRAGRGLVTVVATPSAEDSKADRRALEAALVGRATELSVLLQESLRVTEESIALTLPGFDAALDLSLSSIDTFGQPADTARYDAVAATATATARASEILAGQTVALTATIEISIPLTEVPALARELIADKAKATGKDLKAARAESKELTDKLANTELKQAERAELDRARDAASGRVNVAESELDRLETTATTVDKDGELAGSVADARNGVDVEVTVSDQVMSGEHVVRKYRALGKADDPEAVGYLAGLLYPSPDAKKVAETESLLRTGAVAKPLNQRLWAERLARLAGDAKRGYDEALKQLGSPPLSEMIATLGKGTEVTEEIESARQIVRAYRLAGKPAEKTAVEQLAFLITKAGGKFESIAIVEVWLNEADGAQQSEVVADVPTPALALQPDYAAALKKLGLVVKASRPTNSGPGKAGKDGKDGKDAGGPGSPSINPVAGTGVESGQSKFVIKVEDIPTSLDGTKNQVLAAMLLGAYPDVPQELAWWLATYNGPLPVDPSSDPILTGQGPVAEPAPSTNEHVEGGAGGYHGWAIRVGTSLMGEEAIAADLEVDGEIELTRQESYYSEHIKPLLAMGDWKLWIYKTEEYAEKEKRISELHDQKLMMESLGMSNPVIDIEISIAANESAETRRQSMALMRNDKTPLMRVSAREYGTALTELERLKAITIHEQTETEALFNDMTKHRWLEEAKKDLVSLNGFIASLRAAREAGANFPVAEFRRFIQWRRDRWNTSDGRFHRLTNAGAEVQAIVAAGENFIALGSRAISNVAYWGGAGLTWMYDEPWFEQVGSRAYYGLQGFSRDLTKDSKLRTDRAVAVLGQTHVMLLQVATEAALMYAITGPAAALGGVIGAATLAGRMGMTLSAATNLGRTAFSIGTNVGLATGDGLEAGGKAFLATLIMSVVGRLPVGALGRAYSTFAGSAALDIIDQANWSAGYAEFQKPSPADETPSERAQRIAKATLKEVDPMRAVASALLEVLESSAESEGESSSGALETPSILDLGDGTFLKRDGNSWNAIENPPKDSRVVAINETELGTITSMDASGNRKGADLVIARADSRQDGIAETKDKRSELDRREKNLERRIESDKGDESATKARLAELKAARDAMAKIDATLEVLSLSQKGADIPAELGKLAGTVPPGYVADADGILRLDPMRLAESANRAVEAGERLRESARFYKDKLVKMNELPAALKKAEAARPRDPALIKDLRAKLGIESFGAFAARKNAESAVADILSDSGPIPKPDGTPFDTDLAALAKRETDLDATVKTIREGEPGKVRSEGELSNADVALAMNHQLKRIEPDRVGALIDSFPPGQREKARTVLSASSGFANMESLNSLRIAMEPHIDSDLYTPGRGSLADNIAYVGERYGAFDAVPGVSKRSIFATAQITDNCIVILDGVVLAKIKADPSFAQSLLDHKAILLEPRGFNAGLNMFNTGSTEGVRERVSQLLGRAEELAKSDPKAPFEQSVNRALDEMTRETLEKANPDLTKQLVPVDAKKQLETSNQGISKQLNGNAGVSEAQIGDALAGKSKEEAAIARELLAQRTEILSTRRFAIDLAAKHQDILAQAAAWNVPADKIFFYIPKAAKSYGMIAMAHRLATNTPADRYLDGKADLAARAKEMGPDSLIVMFDDVAGSGDSLVGELGGIGNFEGRVLISPVVSTEEAKIRFDDLKKVIPNGSRVEYQPQRIARALRESPFFQNLSPEQQTKLLKIADRLGHSGNGLSMVFPYMAPDNNNAFFAENFARFFLLNENQDAVK